MHYCTPKRPCNRFRDCDYCARRRQARMADRAESLFDPAQPIKYAVITPDDKTAGAIDRAKKALRRLTGKDRGMWSVEVGEKKGGLHINAIYQGTTIQKVSGCRVHDAGIVKNLRATAAYIYKRSGIPSLEQYEGRTVGQWLTIKQVTESNHVDAVIQASAIELKLRSEFPWLLQYAHTLRPEADKKQIQIMPEGRAWAHLPCLAVAKTWKPSQLNHRFNLSG